MSSVPQLKPDIWLNILERLREPVPTPQRNQIPKDHSAIRQPHLAACLRLNKWIFNLASRVLYNEIVTDSLLALVAGADHASTISGVISKVELLGTTRKLYIEQIHQSHGTHSTAWDDLAEQEVEDLAEAWRIILGRDGEDRPRIFHSLVTVSCGAIFGLRDQLPCFPDNSTIGKCHIESRKSLSRFLAIHPISHFCSPPSTGPLALFASRTCAPTADTADLPLISIHSHSDNIFQPPIAAGARVRWYLHQPLLEQAGYNRHFSDLLRRRIDRTLSDRRDLAWKSKAKAAKLNWNIDPDVFYHLPPRNWASAAGPVGQPFTGHPVPRAEEGQAIWREEAKAASAMAERALVDGTLWRNTEDGEGIEVDDHWRVHQMFDAPPCTACGFCVED